MREWQLSLVSFSICVITLQASMLLHCPGDSFRLIVMAKHVLDNHTLARSHIKSHRLNIKRLEHFVSIRTTSTLPTKPQQLAQDVTMKIKLFFNYSPKHMDLIIWWASLLHTNYDHQLILLPMKLFIWIMTLSHSLRTIIKPNLLIIKL